MYFKINIKGGEGKMCEDGFSPYPRMEFLQKGSFIGPMTNSAETGVFFSGRNVLDPSLEFKPAASLT